MQFGFQRMVCFSIGIYHTIATLDRRKSEQNQGVSVRTARIVSFVISQANGRTKKTHIGFGDDNSSRPLLLLLLCPERTFGSSSPACRSGKGRLHRWQGERRRCEAKERDKSRVQRLSTAKKRVVGGGSEGERWTSFSLTLFSLSLFDLPPSGQPRQQRSFSPCRRDQPRDKKGNKYRAIRTLLETMKTQISVDGLTKVEKVKEEKKGEKKSLSVQLLAPAFKMV